MSEWRLHNEAQGKLMKRIIEVLDKVGYMELVEPLREVIEEARKEWKKITREEWFEEWFQK